MLFDLVLLPLITLSFGLLQARRSERRFRYWLLGWSFVLIGIALWGYHLPHARTIVFEHLRVEVLLAGPLCFVLSFLPESTSSRTTSVYALILGAPLWGAFEVSIFGQGSFALLWTIAAAQALAAAFLLYRQPALRAKEYSVPLALTSLPLVLAALNLLRLPAGDIYTIVLLQLLMSSAVLFYRDTGGGLVSRWIGSIGFTLWAAYYVLHGLIPTHPTLAAVSSQMWNMPKYFVALGMLLKVMEEDTARFGQLDAEYRLLYDNNPHAMWIYDPQTLYFLSVNDAAVRLYGYTREEFLSMTLFDIRPESERERLAEALRAPLNNTASVWQHRRKDGTVFFVDLTSHDVTYCGRPARFVLTMDITDRENLTRDLVYQAQHDTLTGLPNRILFDDRAKLALSTARRDNEFVAVFTIDVDRFKSINETYGHAIGDECIQAIADRLKSRVGEADTLARSGGEEFILVVGGLSSEAEARAMAGSMVARFRDPLQVAGQEVKASISIGVALFPRDGELLHDIRKQSDRALNQAKRMGGNRAVFLSDRLLPEVDNITQIENALRTALSQPGGIELEYQPIFNVDRQIVQIEALVRIPALRAQGIGPNEFIPIAEENGIIIELGARVLEIACRDVAQINRTSPSNIPFAVNVSCNQLLQSGFAEEVLATLARYYLSPSLLHLEITETTLMKDYSQVVNEIGHLASAGVRFSIDDFGTGYSSLERLTELPLDIVKIDRSFTSKLPENTAALGIVQAICHMAHHLSLDIIAEGIETEDQRRLLHSLGVEKLQGFLLSKPIKLADLMERLSQPISITAQVTGLPEPANRLPS